MRRRKLSDNSSTHSTVIKCNALYFKEYIVPRLTLGEIVTCQNDLRSGDQMKGEKLC